MVAETNNDWTISGTTTARNWLNRLAPFLGLLLVIIVFAILIGAPEKYLSLKNLRTVLAQTVIVSVGAIGMTIIIISGGIDLSVGSAIALTGVITALGINAGWSTAVAVSIGILVGGLVGVINGLAITRLRVVPFIATLGMLGVARGVAKGIAGSQTVNMPETWANDLVLTVPKQAWVLVAP
ncbi:MAG TPA: ABC transporter permease, partial [Pyrinomonadaceae bacterium]|nr:ABC transporter permease [Pyrinomonadaceae bacterium]